MIHKSISEAEKFYLTQGCEAGIREDGRGSMIHRSISVESNILPHLNGSARVQIANVIDILCTIKAEVINLNPSAPPKGALEISVDFSPSCNLKLDDRKLADVGSHLAQQLQRVLYPSLDSTLTHLCIIPGKFCWCLHIDLLVTRTNGDPTDACTMAIYAALNCTKIPKVDVTGISGTDDYEVVGDIASAIEFSADCLPICTTFTKVGGVYLLDATAAECACASLALCVAIDRQGSCCSIFKLYGGGFFTEQEMNAALEHARSFVPGVFKIIEGSV